MLYVLIADCCFAACLLCHPGTVSGEVLEEMKERGSLSGNGGLIVTCLLDDQHPLLPFQVSISATADPGEQLRLLQPSVCVAGLRCATVVVA
jgi:hypothetical protein